MTGGSGDTGDPAGPLPDWWEPLRTRVRTATAADFTTVPVPTDQGRPSAVLVLLADGSDGGGTGGGGPGSGGPGSGGPDVLVVQRAATLRTHAGQVAFPGGVTDRADADPAATALREAREEVGLDPATVTVVAELPRLWIPVSDFLVTPVLAWWHAPHPVAPRDPAEVARVARLPVAALADPANRREVPLRGGRLGPGFQVGDLLVWGFTAGVLDCLLRLAGWRRPVP